MSNIRLVISDYDGIILDLKELHYKALNQALASISQDYVISLEEHITTFDGLSTKSKLKLLAETKGFPLEKSDEINNLKQKITLELLNDFSNINYDIVNVVSSLKNEGYLFYVASNAVRKTIEIGLKKLGIEHLVDKIYSNEDVKNSKPNPEIYLKCMADAGVDPFETVIIEDSKNGRQAAVRSGAYVCGIDDSFDFKLETIQATINQAKPISIKWSGKPKTNVLIPAAGLGSRFAQVGYFLPKPLIDVDGKPMIQRVVENLNIDANFIFVVQKEHDEKFNISSYLKLIVPGCKIVMTDGLTEGAACTTLLAKQYINNGDHLLIANSDQLMDFDMCEFMYSMISNNCDGGILTFKATEKKWSYAKTDELGNVIEVAEKNPISDNATCGLYYYAKGSNYVSCAEEMINRNIRTNSEFYVCPIYNIAIEKKQKIKIFPAKKMWGIGTPEDLKFYLENNK